MKGDAKFEEKFQSFKHDMRNLVSTQKSEKLYTDELFLSKAYYVSARNFQRNYVS